MILPLLQILTTGLVNLRCDRGMIPYSEFNNALSSSSKTLMVLYLSVSFSMCNLLCVNFIKHFIDLVEGLKSICNTSTLWDIVNVLYGLWTMCVFHRMTCIDYRPVVDPLDRDLHISGGSTLEYSTYFSSLHKLKIPHCLGPMGCGFGKKKK